MSAKDDNSLLRRELRDFERSYLRDALDRNQWNRAKTARQLGISYRAIFDKIERFGHSAAGRRHKSRRGLVSSSAVQVDSLIGTSATFGTPKHVR